MLVATIYNHDEPAGRIWFDGHTVHAEGLAAERIAAMPIWWGGKRLCAADGEEFLRVLPHVYGNGYGGVELSEKPSWNEQ